MKRKNNNRPPVEMKKGTEQGIQEAFGINLKALREKKALSQEAMSFIAGLSRSYYSEVELGKRNLSLINITKIAAALDVELNKLLTLTEIKKHYK
jgi:transcriptional regulator with XRE-family HTH domain